MTHDYRKTGERMPWVTGKEPVALTRKELAALVGQLKRPIKARCVEVLDLVAVQRKSYVETMQILRQRYPNDDLKSSYAQSTHLYGMKRLGFEGAALVSPANQTRLILENVPPELHEEIRIRVAQTVAKYEASRAQQAETPAWKG